MIPTPEQLDIQALARDFADGEIRPRSAAWDEARRLDDEVFAKLGELGFLGMLVSEDQGGLGFDVPTYLLVVEELARGDAAVGLSVAIHSVVCSTVLRHGSTTPPARVDHPEGPLAEPPRVGRGTRGLRVVRAVGGQRRGGGGDRSRGDRRRLVPYRNQAMGHQRSQGGCGGAVRSHRGRSPRCVPGGAGGSGLPCRGPGANPWTSCVGDRHSASGGPGGRAGGCPRRSRGRVRLRHGGPGPGSMPSSVVSSGVLWRSSEPPRPRWRRCIGALQRPAP
jgi:hypothetical protein